MVELTLGANPTTVRWGELQGTTTMIFTAHLGLLVNLLRGPVAPYLTTGFGFREYDMDVTEEELDSFQEGVNSLAQECEGGGLQALRTDGLGWERGFSVDFGAGLFFHLRDRSGIRLDLRYFVNAVPDHYWAEFTGPNRSDVCTYRNYTGSQLGQVSISLGAFGQFGGRFDKPLPAVAMKAKTAWGGVLTAGLLVQGASLVVASLYLVDVSIGFCLAGWVVAPLTISAFDGLLADGTVRGDDRALGIGFMEQAAYSGALATIVGLQTVAREQALRDCDDCDYMPTSLDGYQPIVLFTHAVGALAMSVPGIILLSQPGSTQGEATTPTVSLRPIAGSDLRGVAVQGSF